MKILIPAILAAWMAALAVTADMAVPSLHPAVFWEGQGVQVFLVSGDGDDLRLTVLGAAAVEVVARTERNSQEAVTRKLVPLEPKTPGITQYRFQHRFSRTTIWLGLDFFQNGRRLADLSRVFYGSIRADGRYRSH